MKSLKRIVAVLLIFILCITNHEIASATKMKDYCIMEHDGFTFTMDDLKTITPKYYWTRGLWNNDDYNPEVAIYYQVKEIAKLLKGKKKEFNFKYNSQNNSLTFYPEKDINTKDVDVKLSYTSAEKSNNKSWGEDLAFDRGTKVYTDNKAISAKVLVYKGTFYMKLKDIAKAADFGLSMTEDQLRYNINTKKDYNGVEAWRPDISVYKIEVDMKPVYQTYYDDDIIKSPYPDAEYIKSPRTKEDFDKLIQYMLANNIVTCNVKTNIPYEEMVKYNILADIIYTSDYLGRFKNRYESLYLSSTYDLKQDGKYGMLEIKLKGHNGESDKQLAKKAKLFNDKMMEALQEMNTNGELTAEMTETEKAKAIFTWIAKHVEYDWYSYLNDINDNYTAYDALIDQTAICAGYAGLYNMMCKYIGLYQIEYISGEADGFLGRGGHAWTAQILDGKKVMTDATWGDAESSEEGISTVDYDWFARPISYFKKNNHYWDSKDYPIWK